MYKQEQKQTSNVQHFEIKIIKKAFSYYKSISYN